MSSLAILGGTGAQGMGLALRFAAAGERIVIGSRAAERAAAAADDVRRAVPGAEVEGRPNLEAITAAECVVFVMPASGLASFLELAADRLDGRLVVDAMVPLVVEKGVASLVPLEGAASASEIIQRRCPRARVVSAFKTVPSDALRDLERRLEGDVLLCGDDAAARAEVADLVAKLPGLRAVDVGPLRLARYVEGVTALLVSLNLRHKALTSLAIRGLPRSPVSGRAP